MTAHYDGRPRPGVARRLHRRHAATACPMPESVDAVVTDPPYGLEFMGEWDKDGHQRTMLAFQNWTREWATEAYRLLKPGGHLLAFGGTRTHHRLASGIEDAGFEIRDSIAWLYGSGFPKSLDVGKAIDRMAGAEREVVGQSERVTPRTGKSAAGFAPGGVVRWGDEHYRWEDAPAEAVAYYTAGGEKRGQITAPAPADAARWNGWGTALKPAFEPIVVARKPLAGTVAANVLAYGTGALNIDGSRIGTTDDLNGGGYSGKRRDATGASAYAIARRARRVRATCGSLAGECGPRRIPSRRPRPAERRPARNDRRGPPQRRSTGRSSGGESAYGTAAPRGAPPGYGDTGGASRFFYTAKASTDERPSVDGIAHPTVKPVDLMRWLVKLVTPPGGSPRTLRRLRHDRRGRGARGLPVHRDRAGGGLPAADPETDPETARRRPRPRLRGARTGPASYRERPGWGGVRGSPVHGAGRNELRATPRPPLPGQPRAHPG
jgi:hypothetical protein